MNMSNKLLHAPLVLGLAALSTVHAQEKKIKRGELPPAVEKTVAQESKDATIRGFSTEMEKGKRFYEVELMVSGHSKDILMDERGNITEIEEEVSMDSLPAAVKEGLMKMAGTGTISKVESLTKKGNLVAYEGHVKAGTKHREIQVGPDGKKLARPE
jgi:hypothetical protein